jgi:hypothetical protein
MTVLNRQAVGTISVNAKGRPMQQVAHKSIKDANFGGFPKERLAVMQAICTASFAAVQ